MTTPSPASPRSFTSACPTHGGVVSSSHRYTPEGVLTGQARLPTCPVCHQALKPLPRANLRGGIGEVLGRLAKQRERARGQARAEKSQRKLREEQKEQE